MSYTIPNPQPTITGLDALVADVCAKYIPEATTDTVNALVADGQVAMLTPTTPLIDGTATFPVWGACAGMQKPGTHEVQMLGMVIAGKNGAPWIKANGDPVATYFWHTVSVQEAAKYTQQQIRNDMLLFLLQEPQPNQIVKDQLDNIQTHLSIITRANVELQLSATSSPAL
jgi:hypothetical protein